MKYSLVLTIILLLLSCQMYSQNVGINNSGSSPDPSAILDISSPNQGFLMPRLQKNIRLTMNQPAEGLMVFDSTLNNLFFYRNNSWSLVGEDGPFKVFGNLIVQKNNYDNDFIVGHPILPSTGPAVTENFFFFHESKGVFRAGGLNNSMDWHHVNNGFYSTAFGLNTQAKGDYSFSAGSGSKSIGINSVAFGATSTSTGSYSFSMGQNLQSEGEYAVSFGNNGLAEGDYSMVVGKDLVAPSFGELAIGSYNTDYSAISKGAFYPTDRAFVIGGGSVISDRDLFSVWKDGKVSMGHGNPVAKLDIIAEPGEDLIKVFSNSKNRMRLQNDGKFIIGGGSYNARLQANAAHQEHVFQLKINGFQRFFVDSLGRAVVGANPPQARFDVQAFNNEQALNVDIGGERKFFIDADGQIIVGDAIPDARLQISSDFEEDPLLVKVNNTQQFLIDGDGQTIIGDAVPDARLQINSDIQEDPLLVKVNNTQQFFIDENGKAVIGQGVPDARLEIQAITNEKAFNIDIQGTRAFLVDSDGQVAVGNAVPGSRLQVNALTGEDAFRVRVNGTTKLLVDSEGGWSNYNANPTFALQLENSSVDLRGRGRAYSWNTYSDRRIKSNIRNLEYGLTDLMKLQAMSYDHHTTNHEHERINIETESSPDIGLIAQEVYEVIPEAVSKPSDDTDELWTMDYTRLVPLLIKSIQEQQEMIEELREEIELLKNRN